MVGLCRGAVPDVQRADVMVVDAALRDAAAEDVRPAMARALDRLHAAGAELRMLKIDSTLRGPVGQMAEALLDLTTVRGAIVAPAFPEQGRLVVGGRLEVNGVDVGTDIVALLQREGTTYGSIKSDRVRIELRSMSSEGKHDKLVLVVDTHGVDDLATTARDWSTEASPPLLVGSAGLARQVARVWRRSSESRPEQVASRLKGTKGHTILVVAGSPADATRRQTETLIATPDCEIQVFTTSDGLVDQLATEVSLVGDVSDTQRPRVLLIRTPRGTVRDHGQAAKDMATAVGSIMDAVTAGALSRPRGLVLVGGDTAARVLATLGVDALEIRGEVEVGMPFGELLGGAWDRLPVITKAGGFGGEGSLVSAVGFLSRKPDPSSTRALRSVAAGDRSV